MWDAKPGMKVICISDFKHKYDEVICPKKNCIYTIREVSIGTYNNQQAIGLRFKEIVNPIMMFKNGLSEAGFLISLFRPLEHKGLTALKELLVNPRKEIKDDTKHIDESKKRVRVSQSQT